MCERCGKELLEKTEKGLVCGNCGKVQGAESPKIETQSQAKTKNKKSK